MHERNETKLIIKFNNFYYPFHHMDYTVGRLAHIIMLCIEKQKIIKRIVLPSTKLTLKALYAYT